MLHAEVNVPGIGTSKRERDEGGELWEGERERDVKINVIMIQMRSVQSYTLSHTACLPSVPSHPLPFSQVR